ncbi:MAG: SusE domain-containing protein [Chitinophagaceae bacterium]|nr:SusE domain-containing protein [Chitinophagaceae bacterium]
MKKYFKLLVYTVASLLMITGCDKDENRVFLEGGDAPVLTATKTAVSLTPGNEDQTAITFNWTNPEYELTTGVSSHDVKYTFELDTLGANFSSANKYVTTITKELSKSYTERELNSIMGNTLQVKTGRQYTFEARISSSLGTAEAAKLTSEVFKFTATPFTPPPKVALPTTGKLYIIGNGTPGDDATGWNNPVPVPSQEFTKISETVYEITIALNGGKSILFLPLNGDWGDKYAFDGAKNGNNPDGDILRRGGEDIKVPATSGTYKVRVDFQLGRFTITKI